MEITDARTLAFEIGLELFQPLTPFRREVLLCRRRQERSGIVQTAHLFVLLPEASGEDFVIARPAVLSAALLIIAGDIQDHEVLANRTGCLLSR